jgi:TrmH family RNA methyltransferase
MDRPRIESRQNETVKYLRALLRDSSLRREAGEYVGEGFKLYVEAQKQGLVRSVYLADRAAGFAVSGDVPVVSFPDPLFDYVSDQQNGQGLLFTCKMRTDPLPEVLSGNYLLLDGISDPGNMGTIIRTADAFAIDGLILCGNCVDRYNPKVVRGAMGGLFRLPVFEAGYDEISALIGSSNIPFYRAEARDGAVPAGSVSLKNAVVAVGNEAAGISAELRKAKAMGLMILMPGGAESLNAAVAASIFMWEMSKA